MRKLVISVVALLLVAAPAAYGQQEGDFPPTDLTKVGTCAANFLKIPVGGRALSFVGGGIATVNDATALFWNPAGIAAIDRFTVAYNRTDMYAGIKHSFTAAVLPLGLNTRLGIHYLGLNSGEMEVTTVDVPDGTGEYFTVLDMSLGVTFTQILTDRFALGLTGKFVQERVHRVQANAFALDIGSTFNTGLLGTRLGMSLMNLGTKMQLTGPDLAFTREVNHEDDGVTAGLNPASEVKTLEYDLPLIFRMGISLDLLGGLSTFMANDMNRVTVLIDMDDAVDQIARLGLSMEYAWNETIYGRIGYRLRSKLGEEMGRYSGTYRELMSFGYGLGLNTVAAGYAIQLDYGMADYGDLGTVSQLFLSIGF
jgi:hypothetical protein